MDIKQLIIEATADRLRKELVGRRISINSFNNASLNENGKYKIIDAKLNMEKSFFYDGGWNDYNYVEFEYFDIKLDLVAETLTAKRKRYPKMDIDHIIK